MKCPSECETRETRVQARSRPRTRPRHRYRIDKERRKEREIGLFGIGTDWEKVKAIEAEEVPSCEEYKRVAKILSSGRR